MGAKRKGITKPRAKQEPTIAEIDKMNVIKAVAGEIETLAECYATFAPDFSRKQMGDLIAIIGERCGKLTRLIDDYFGARLA
jgi:hypothetical protein